MKIKKTFKIMIDIKIYQTIPHYNIRGEWSQNILVLYNYLGV
jgi:hypothetical protein